MRTIFDATSRGPATEWRRLCSRSASDNRIGRCPMGDNDAIALLKADHKEVSEMFEKFETARSTKEKLARQICQALTVHAQIEEEIFYPAAREALGEDGKDLLDEAKVEHNALKG